jgi:hypothetical protein
VDRWIVLGLSRRAAEVRLRRMRAVSGMAAQAQPAAPARFLGDYDVIADLKCGDRPPDPPDDASAFVAKYRRQRHRQVC